MWLSRRELHGLLNCKVCYRFVWQVLVLTKNIGKTLGGEGILRGWGTEKEKDERKVEEYYKRRMNTEDPFSIPKGGNRVKIEQGKTKNHNQAMLALTMVNVGLHCDLYEKK